jgi:tetratricopeptide (TPR) repeat protein
MKGKYFKYKFENSNITLTGGTINQISAHLNTISCDNNSSLANIVLREDTGLEDFEIELAGSIKKKSKFSHLSFQIKNKIGSLFTVVISLIIVIFLTLLAIHESLSYDLFSGGNGSTIFSFNILYFYIFLSLVIILFLVISPKVILGEYENLFDWANARFSTHGRIVRRLVRGLVICYKPDRESAVLNIWNPLVAGNDSWLCQQLVPALISSSLPVNIIIKTDEKDAFLEVLKANDLEKYLDDEKPEHETNPDKIFPYHLLSTWEKECMHCLISCSTNQLPGSWKEKETNPDTTISVELAERAYYLYRNSFSSGTGSTTFEKFMNRCIYDYGYMKPTIDQRTDNYILIDSNFINELDSVILEKVKDSIRNNIGSISSEIDDPLAFVILIGLTEGNNTLNTRTINLLSGFIKNVDRIENYQLMSSYWKFISPGETGANDNFSLKPLHFLDVQTLTDLSVCFVNSGMYDNAFEVYDILKSISPAKIEIEIADLYDSLGNYKKALEILLETDEKWFKSGFIQDIGLILKLYLNISWVIVNGRFKNRKNEGYQYLDKTDVILKKLPDAEKYLMYLTQFFNTKANYFEWDENYEAAIGNYEEALKLPGSILRKSSLLSNQGISERLLAKKSDDIVTKRKHLLTSCSNLQRAVNMKISIGEKNQIPGASHNLSETLIELAAITNNKTERFEILKEADFVTTRALDILDKLNSHKRRGRLLAEKYITHFMLRELGEPSNENALKKSLDNWLINEDKDSYDYREIMRLLEQFSLA